MQPWTNCFPSLILGSLTIRMGLNEKHRVSISPPSTLQVGHVFIFYGHLGQFQKLNSGSSLQQGCSHVAQVPPIRNAHMKKGFAMELPQWQKFQKLLKAL